jgi:3-isopropylmalate/(R)-2-methylmalate dehydratase small subunit
MKMQGNELQIHGLVACIDRDNIDTDQIIPTEYLKSIKKFGFEDYLFDGWRYLDDGKLGITKEQRQINEDFILNNAPYDQASILLTRDNFGCGSSREHAVWALRDFGIKTVIASSFGDIFYNNCFKNGVLPIKLSKEQIEELFSQTQDTSNEITVSLDAKKLTIAAVRIIY